MAAQPTPQRNGPGQMPPAATNAEMKALKVDGDLYVLGQPHEYYKLEVVDGEKKGIKYTAEVQGFGVVSMPSEAGWVQVHIIYPEYKDVINHVADHLVYHYLQVSELAIPMKPQLVVPGRA